MAIDEAPGEKKGTKWLWLILLIVAFALIIVWLANPAGDTDEAEAEGADAAVADTIDPIAGEDAAVIPGGGDMPDDVDVSVGGVEAPGDGIDNPAAPQPSANPEPGPTLDAE